MNDEDLVIAQLAANNNQLSLARLAANLGWGAERTRTSVGRSVDNDLATVGPGRGGVVYHLGRRAPNELAILSFLKKPENRGQSILNKTIRDACRLTEDDFWPAHRALRGAGLISVEPCRGGKSSYAGNAAPEPPPAAIDYAVEESLYPALLSNLKAHWLTGYAHAWMVNTARLGRRPTGGRWTRPDLLGVTIDSFKLIPMVSWDVYSFEVKKPGDCTVIGLHEALAHARFATMPYAIFVTQGRHSAEESAAWRKEADRLNVGLIVVADVERYDTWEFISDPERHSVDFWTLDKQLVSLLDPETSQEVARVSAQYFRHLGT